HKHFMHKEIHEQPRALADTVAGRARLARADADLDDAGITDAKARKFRRAVVVACGTSWHAGLVGKFYIERLARLPTEVDLASEFRYRPPLVGPSDLVVAISQSGETADTLAAVREAKALGASVLAVCNVLGSSLARMADHTLYTHAGPEIGVASTKAFVTQLAALLLVAVRLGRARRALAPEKATEELGALTKVAKMVQQVLGLEPKIKQLAEKFAHAGDFLYLGRGVNFPIALEGALKLKEISYIHAEGYPAGEMKHGPIALIDENVPVVAIATRNSVYEKVLGNLAEVRARRGTVIAVCSQRDRTIGKAVDHQLAVPRTTECVEPIVNVVPLQLLAYHIADFNGTDVDQPRNLAKSVTVE
ncbi:MAG: glutamine--fructose-6-phosphate transaminase (isomerizing), partial [Deltaproteobacteria bacterium]